MGDIALRNVVNESLIRRFQGASSSGTSGQAVASALKGGDSKAGIQAGLRVGARTYATAVQGLNAVINFINVSQATLGKLQEITDKLSVVAKKAADGSTQDYSNLNSSFRSLARDFRETVEQANLRKRDYLTVDGLGGLFTMVGLDPERSDSVAQIFRAFVTSGKDDILASEYMQGRRPVPLPPSAFQGSQDGEDGAMPFAGFTQISGEAKKIFNGPPNLANPLDAALVSTDLKALSEQIAQNSRALDNALTVVGENIELVRAAGLAFLDLSNQIKGEAEATEVAEQLRKSIRKNARAALAQAENLEPIAVAALVLGNKEFSL